LDIVVFTLIDNFQYQHQFIDTENIAHQDKTFMVFNATFKNILVILWWSILLVEEIRVPGENHRPVASRRKTA
jgi:hypothetical protein